MLPTSRFDISPALILGNILRNSYSGAIDGLACVLHPGLYCLYVCARRGTRHQRARVCVCERERVPTRNSYEAAAHTARIRKKENSKAARHWLGTTDRGPEIGRRETIEPDLQFEIYCTVQYRIPEL